MSFFCCLHHSGWGCVCSSVTQSSLSVYCYVYTLKKISHWRERTLPSPSLWQGWVGLMQHPFRLHHLTHSELFYQCQLWDTSLCTKIRSLSSVSTFSAAGLDISSSFTPPPLPLLSSYPVVQRGQVHGGRHDDRWLYSLRGLYINAKELRFSYTHKHRCTLPLGQAGGHGSLHHTSQKNDA